MWHPNVEILKKITYYGQVFTSPFINKWFYWEMLNIVLHYRDWKYGNFRIAFLLWVTQSIGDMIEDSVNLYAYENQTNDAFAWKHLKTPTYAFWYLGEIIADWYIVLIIKRISTNKKIGLVGSSCLLFNCTKILVIVHYIMNFDHCREQQATSMEPNFTCLNLPFWRIWLVLQIIMALGNFLFYGICFWTLRSDPDPDKEKRRISPHDYTFVKCFRRDTRYRMMFSCIVAMTSSALALPLVFDFLFKTYSFRLEGIRDFVMSITYYMVYIDQILKRDQVGGQAFHSTSNNSCSTSTISSKPNFTTSANQSKFGFSSKIALENANIPSDPNNYLATPWKMVDDKNTIQSYKQNNW